MASNTRVVSTVRPVKGSASTRGPWARFDALASHWAGSVVFVITTGLFSILALSVAAKLNWLVRLDESIQTGVIAGRTEWMNDAMVWISRLGTRWVIGAALLGLTVWVLRTGRCQKALAVVVLAFLFNPLIEHILKLVVGRPRPELHQLVPGRGPSFPSGHVLATIGFYGVLAVVIWRSSARLWIKIAADALATAVIVLVAFSRIYLGVHWFSDVIGGLLVGSAFVLAVAWSLRDHHFSLGFSCLHTRRGKTRQTEAGAITGTGAGETVGWLKASGESGSF